MPWALRWWQIACVFVSTCPALNERSKAEPRWPEAPKATRCTAIVGSGMSVWCGQNSLATSIRIEGGAA